MWEIRGGIAQNLSISSIDIEQDPKESDIIEVTAYPARDGIFKSVSWDEIQEKLQKLLDRSNLKDFHLKVKVASRLPVLFLAEDVPAYGYKSYFVEYHDGTNALHMHESLLANSVSVENEYYKVEVERGIPTFRITDKLSGEIYENCNLLVDGGDKGDTHTFCSPEADRIASFPVQPFKASLVEDGPVRQTLKIELGLKLPKSLSEDRRSRSNKTIVCPLATSVSLHPKVKRIDFRTEIDNKAKDHRLRVYFPTRIKTDFCYAEGNFDVIMRKIDTPEATGWTEKPSGVYPQRTFVDVNDEKTGLTLINKGLPEFQVIREEEGSTIALTLLRCIERLGRTDLNTRRGGAGPYLEIPKAQCLGRYVFEYSLVLHRGTWESSEVYKDAHWFNTPLRAFQTNLHSGKLSPELSFIEVEPPSLIVSALKKSEKGDFLIVRLYNTLRGDKKGRIKIFEHWNDAKLVNLMEEAIDNQSLPKGDKEELELQIGGGEIKTIRFTMKKEAIYDLT